MTPALRIAREHSTEWSVRLLRGARYVDKEDNGGTKKERRHIAHALSASGATGNRDREK